MDQILLNNFGMYDTGVLGNQEDGYSADDEDEEDNNTNDVIVDVVAYKKLVEDGSQDLYVGCTSFSKLQFIVRLLNIKNTWKVPNGCYDEILLLFKEALPQSHALSGISKIHASKRYIKDIGIGYESIHACKNDCIMFRGAHKDDTLCPICNTSRWKSENAGVGGKRMYKVPQKVTRHFKLKPRVRRFSEDPRNIRFALTTDGFNPFENMSISYNIWTVIRIPLNLRPWVCTKQSNFILSVIVPGRKGPGKEMDVYMQLAIDDLQELWKPEIWTHDAITDGASFNGKDEFRDPPVKITGQEISEMTATLHTDNGKLQKPKPPRRKKRTVAELQENEEIYIHSVEGTFKRRSVFFQLEYWQTLLVRYNLDIMHVQKNVFENIMNTILDVDQRSKDNLNARLDLEDMNIRTTHHADMTAPKPILPRASYQLLPQAKNIFCTIIKYARFPDGYASNLYHKVIDVDEMEHWEAEIAQILCKLEMIFPPSFFDMMVHVTIHLASEVRIDGPVQFRDMWSTERFVGTLKDFVQNMTYPEGSLAENYQFDEFLTFCSIYLNGYALQS
ncbi:uncharacterized protein [Lolium perenne]|uniref:uncharacterized protein n=1 Tax=Lolium perenne TaxID=4522 RepID=UPI0021F507E1|nr:uncharacterized protein LOC127340427 [Lolium perenne]